MKLVPDGMPDLGEPILVGAKGGEGWIAHTVGDTSFLVAQWKGVRTRIPVEWHVVPCFAYRAGVAGVVEPSTVWVVADIVQRWLITGMSVGSVFWSEGRWFVGGATGVLLLEPGVSVGRYGDGRTAQSVRIERLSVDSATTFDVPLRTR